MLFISIAGVGIRHWFNIRHLEKRSRLILPASLLILLGVIIALRPHPPVEFAAGSVVPSDAEILDLVQQRCVICHAAQPQHPGFAAAPLGIVLEDEAALQAMAQRIYQTTVVTQAMPLANATGMTAEERDLIARWYSEWMRQQDAKGEIKNE